MVPTSKSSLRSASLAPAGVPRPARGAGGRAGSRVGKPAGTRSSGLPVRKETGCSVDPREHFFLGVSPIPLPQTLLSPQANPSSILSLFLRQGHRACRRLGRARLAFGHEHTQDPDLPPRKAGSCTEPDAGRDCAEDPQPDGQRWSLGRDTQRREPHPAPHPTSCNKGGALGWQCGVTQTTGSGTVCRSTPELPGAPTL